MSFSGRGRDFSERWCERHWEGQGERYEEARDTLFNSLHITHPVMQAILTLGDRNRSLLLLDLSNVRYVPCVTFVPYPSLLLTLWSECVH